MASFFVLLLKINLVLALFAIAYYLILRRLTFYTVNRAFLAFGMLFSTLYPFVDLSRLLNQQSYNWVGNLSVIPATVQASFIDRHWNTISYFFYGGILLMAIRLSLQFFSLYRLHKRSRPGFISRIPVRLLQEPLSPFSFWQHIYINPQQHDKEELQTILAHERVHVKQWHTLDILLAEFSLVFYWFNPGVWLMRKAVKENLEFITDAKIIRKGIDKKAYQYSLIGVSQFAAPAPLANSFNLSDIRKRIKMMNSRPSSRIALSRYFLLLPLLLLAALAFTVSRPEKIQDVLILNELPAADASHTNSKPSPQENQPVYTIRLTPTQAATQEDKKGNMQRNPDGVKRVQGVALETAIPVKGSFSGTGSLPSGKPVSSNQFQRQPAPSTNLLGRKLEGERALALRNPTNTANNPAASPRKNDNEPIVVYGYRTIANKPQ